MKTHERIGIALKAFREDHGVTQRAMAKIIGCYPSAIGCAERGRLRGDGRRQYIGSIELLEAMAWALGLDLSDLARKKPRALSAVPADRRKVA